MDASVDDTQHFKVLVEELHIARKVSIQKLSKLINVPFMTSWRWVKRLGVQMRDRITAVQLAKTKYSKRDFDGSGVEKLRMWFLAHMDGYVRRTGRQVNVTLGTPDPYLVFLFKELFGKYGNVGVAPYRKNDGQYMWQAWVYLPSKSFAGLLKKEAPASIDGGKLYGALSMAIDTDGTISAYKQTRGETTESYIAFCNEKEYVIKPLQRALTHLKYNLNLGKVPRGRKANYGITNSDFHYFSIRRKADVKRLLKYVKPALYHKRLKVYLIRRALSDPAEPVHWKDFEPMYTEINAIHEEMLAESKSLVEALHVKLHSLRELFKSRQINWKQYEEKRAELRVEAWKALEELKAKYDEKFSNLKRRIEARFRARKLSKSQVKT